VAPFNLGAPDWRPGAGSPALPGNEGHRNPVAVWDIDPWFTPVCYLGASDWDGDWWEGWIYTNYANGAGRTDLPAWPDSNITTFAVNTTLTPGRFYVLQGRVDVQAGVTLTIEAGSIVRGLGQATYLVVERDADLVVNGTAASPVILTSNAAPGDQLPGDWGGVVIHGNAVANCASADGCGLTSVEGDCESEGGAGFFGGDDDNDDSGSIRYARVEYAGEVLLANNELNAWTFNGVGSGTTIEYLQAHLGTDDLFEWFGGTVGAKYLVGTGGDDDNIDWQMGFRGKLQFVVCQQAGDAITPNEDNGIEADNNEFDEDCPGRSCPTLSNLTLIGDGPNGAGGGRGMRIRVGTAGTVVNSIVQGWGAEGIRIDPSSLDNCAYQGILPEEECDGDLAAGVEDPAFRGNGLVAAAAPNPTRGAAGIYFSLERAGKVRVQVFDLRGRVVDTLAEGHMAAGEQAVTWNAASAPAGIYVYRVVESDSGRTASGKIVVAR
jgi:hypothetical protein